MPHYTTIGGYPNPDPYGDDMSYEAWGDGDESDYGYTEARMEEISLASFRRGAQMMREMLARFVEQGGDTTTAASIRANWNPEWRGDPGKPSDEDYEQDRTGFDPFVCA